MGAGVGPIQVSDGRNTSISLLKGENIQSYFHAKKAIEMALPVGRSVQFSTPMRFERDCYEETTGRKRSALMRSQG